MSNASPTSQLCVVVYSDNFRLRRDAMGFVNVVEQLSERLDATLTDFSYHTRENLEDEGDNFAYDQQNLGRLRQIALQEPLLDLMVWSTDGNHDPAWDIYAEMVDAKDIYGTRYVYVQFPHDLIRHLSEPSQFELIRGLFSSLNLLESVS